MKKRLLLVLGFVIAMPMLGLVVIILLPIFFILWFFTGKEYMIGFEKIADYWIQFPFKISKYQE